MSTHDLTQTLARFGGSYVHPIVVESWQRSRAAGLDPDAPPRFRSVAPADLQRRLSENRVLVNLAIPHLRWLSRWFQQRPHVAYIADRDGVVLHAEGDPVAIDRYHLSPGHDWSEASMGTNGAGTALAAGVPVAVVGCDHWSLAWKDATCLGAPIHGPDGRPVAALDISLDLQPGDADRLVVVAHVAHAISQELARCEAESRSEATEALYEAVRAALDAEQRARTETEAALARARAAEAAQRESQARLTLALEGAAMGMWELNLATEVCTWSEQTATLFGLPHGATSLPLPRFLELIHPDDRDAVRQAKASAAAGASCDVEFRAIWPDGTLHWINGKGQVGPTPDGQGLRLVGIGQDITARKEQDAALRLSEHRLQAIVDSTPALVYVVDAAGRFCLINRRFAELFALEPSAVIGRPLTDYFPPVAADQFAANNRRVLDSGDVCEFEEIVELGGDLRTFISVKAPLVDEAGAPDAVCGVSTDITERKRLMSALELAQRQKDAVVATVAHELRQPIAAIGAALAVMQTGASREMGERARAIANRQVQQLARIVDDLLDAARIAQGKVTLRRERIPLRQVLEAAVTVVQPLVQQRAQQLQVHLPADALWLDADAARLQQVFSNLLTNAVKFTGPDGRITVSVEPAPDTVTVRIRDTGRGIAPDTLPHIFDLFTQAAPDGHGLGIGLAVVRRLVEQHGGSVEGRSEGPGQGSEFIVRLPLAPAAVQLT
jgi:PAS domain S-box-containing protein